MSEDEYIKEGDIILVDSRDNNSITEVKITDISPSGEYLEITSNGIGKYWVHSNRHLETLVSASGDDSEYIDIDEIAPGSVSAQDILSRIRNRAEEFDVDENIESEVIQIDRFAQLDLRNKKK